MSWLPLYHDMGLIGACMGSLYYACPLVLMSPLAFLARPQRWLWAIHQHHGTISAAPNFAYELCLRRIDDRDIEGLDLSSWQMALNGAEPISPDTVTRFCERFAKYGFRPQTMTPVYGLAESSLGAAFPPPGRGVRIDRIRREPFTRSGQAIPADEDDSTALRFVSCGRPFPGIKSASLMLLAMRLLSGRSAICSSRAPRRPAATSATPRIPGACSTAIG